MPRMTDYDQPALAAVIKKQHGVLTRAQARECGMTDRVVKYRCRNGGPWQSLLPGVYLTHTGIPADGEREMAALLYAGPRSVLTAQAALRRYDLSGHRTDWVDVLVPQRTQRADAGFARLHRTIRLPERVAVAGEIRYVLPPRAVADAVRGLPNLRDVRAVVAEAVQRGRCSLQLLAEELDNGPSQKSALLRQALSEVMDGVRSTAESDLRDLIIWAKLPTPLYNPKLLVDGEFLAQPDCWWPDQGVAAEADSRAWHLSPQDWENTVARHARMSAQRIIVLHFTPAQIRKERLYVAEMIAAALTSAGDRPLPHIRTVPVGRR